MKTVLKGSFCAFFLGFIACIASGKSDLLVDYDMKTSTANQLVDKSGNNRNGKLIGNPRFVTENGQKFLRLNGTTQGVDILNSADINAADNITYIATIRMNNPISATNGPAHFDAVFYKNKQFVLSRRGDNFYCNFNNGKSWVGSMLSPGSIKLETGKWYHLALSFDFHNVSSQGEVWTTMRLYVNGANVANKTVQYTHPANTKATLQLGKADGFGKVWRLNGDIASASVYGKTLSSSDIQKLVLKEKLVKPAFVIPKTLTKSQRIQLKKLSNITQKQKTPLSRKVSLALVSCLRSIALTQKCTLSFEHHANKLRSIISSQADAQTILKQWNHNSKVVSMLSGDSVLTVALDRNKFFILNLSDLKNSQEAIRGSADLWEIATASNKVNSSDKTVKAAYLRKPQNNSEKWTFSVQWELADTKKAVSNFTFYSNRLEYDLEVTSRSNNTQINQVIFPRLKLTRKSGKRPVLLVPEMSGVEHEYPIEKAASYSGNYPSGHCSMQLGAYYDNTSGVYFATEDPYASSKSLAFQPDATGISVQYVWQNGGSSFKTRSVAALELFNGNWFDAAQIYRKWLVRQKPIWWLDSIPRKDSPKWFENNTLWIRFYDGEGIKEQIKQFAEWVGLPIAVHWYLWHGDLDRDYPHYYPNPDSYDTLQWLMANGIHAVPYINGRLWETKDRMDEDYQFTKIALPATVKSIDGKPIYERYHNATFGVMCPASKVWQDKMHEVSLRLPRYGFDGIYYDQIAAARPRFCYANNHGHLPGHQDTWFLKGYLPMLSRIRNDLHKQYPNAVMTSEDVSEPYMKLLDGMLPWRWMINGQVPLLPAIYSGRTQFVGLSFGREQADAKFAMLASQLVTSQQLGWFTMKTLNSPKNKQFRKFVKQSMHLRHALLKFFNCGKMSRPVNFESTMPSKSLKWGTYGTQFVTSPAIMSSAWNYHETTMYIMVNTTEKPQSQRVQVNFSDAVQLHRFNTVTGYSQSNEKKSFTKDILLPPYSAEVWIMSDQQKDISEVLRPVKNAFKKIVTFKKDNDIFEAKFVSTPPKNAYQFQEAYTAPLVLGAIRQSHRHAVGNIDGSSIIYFGTIDFGKTSPQEIEAYLAVANVEGHKMMLAIGNRKKPRVIAEFPNLKSTGGWGNFKPFRAKLSGNITGKHKVFMIFDGPDGTCNVKKWRAIK